MGKVKIWKITGMNEVTVFRTSNRLVVEEDVNSKYTSLLLLLPQQLLLLCIFVWMPWPTTRWALKTASKKMECSGILWSVLRTTSEFLFFQLLHNYLLYDEIQCHNYSVVLGLRPTSRSQLAYRQWVQKRNKHQKYLSTKCERAVCALVLVLTVKVVERLEQCEDLEVITFQFQSRGSLGLHCLSSAHSPQPKLNERRTQKHRFQQHTNTHTPHWL